MARRQQKRPTRLWYAAGSLLVLLLVFGGGGYYLFGRPGNASGAPQPGGAIDGIQCQAEMLNYHIHAALTLYRNGKPVPVPAYIGNPFNPAINVGGQNSCLYWLHTHAYDAPQGVIHIESPTSNVYNLGQFLDIWRYTSTWDSQANLGAGLTVDASIVTALNAATPQQIHAYVDGKPYTGDYRKITLTKHKLITVELGTPLVPPTTHLAWQQGD